MTTPTEAAVQNCYARRPAVPHVWGDDDRCVECGTTWPPGPAEGLTPAEILTRIAELAAALPPSRGKRLYLGVSPEVRSLVASLPGAKNGDTPGYATARVGELDVYAFHRSPVELLADMERERQEKADPRIVAHPPTEGISSAVTP